MKSLSQVRDNLPARIRELVGNDQKLAAALRAAIGLAKKDAVWRDKANTVARDFVMNRRALGKAIPASGVSAGRPGKNTVTLTALGLDQSTSKRAQILASIPEDELSGELERMAETDIIQIAPLYRLAKALKRKKDGKERAASTAQREGLVEDLADVPGEWRCIYADPPWAYGDSTVKGGGVAHQYSSMSIEQICAMPVGALAHEEGAHLWLWTTWPMIRDQVPHVVLEAWGFDWKGEIIWHKLSARRQETFFGVGRWLRPATEVLIFAVRKGEKEKRPPPLLRTGKELMGFCSHCVLGHSRKPERFRELIDQLSPGPRIELFARRAAAGWSRWGDQA